ncbi:MAG: tyrosine-type recombinase/integrase, partial [Candidatus Competibacteraceae bacterium]|nr:tyrosine-type recombinase/integrase [Candidatus Competibacteraceae bacterium]
MADKGHSKGYIARIINTGRAAVNHAWKNGELAAPVYFVPASVPKHGVAPRGKLLSTEDCVALFAAIQTAHLMRFCLLLVGTLARPGALLELHTRQLDFDHGLIHLNPEWREQTKKYRPTVKMPVFLRNALEPLPAGNVVSGNSAPFKSVKKAFRATRTRAGLEATVTPYSFRHTLTRWLRSRSVPAWEVAAQLGHRAPGTSTTEI